MLTDRETLFVEAILMLAVPLSVGLATLTALLALS